MNWDEHILSSANCSKANEKRTLGQIVLDQMFSSRAIFGNTEVHFSSHLHGESFTFNQSAAETILMTFVLLN